MGQVYPLELRTRVVASIEAGNSYRKTARNLQVSVGFVVKTVKLKRETGSVTPKPQGRPSGRYGKLRGHMDFLLEIISQDPDLTLEELASALEEARGIKVHFTTIHYALKRIGLTYKKRLTCQ